MQVSFPLFVLAKDCGEIKKYGSVEDLGHFEDIDVENEEFDAWDRTGASVRLIVQKGRGIGAQLLSESPDAPELRQALISYARSVGIELPADLPVSDFEAALAQIWAERKRIWAQKSWIRRFLSRF